VLSSETPQLSELQQYTLPILRAERTARKFNPREGARGSFSLPRLLFALQNSEISHVEVQEYFSYFHANTVKESLNENVERVPSIFYAVARNDMNIIKTWIGYGGNVNAVDERYSVPLLAFSILNSANLGEDTTSATIMLLANGAKSNVFPSAFSGPCLGDLPPFAPVEGNPLSIPTETRWCTEFFWERLRKSLNISQRYFLWRARRCKQPSGRLLQAAMHYNATSLLSLPYSIIGQDMALQLLRELVLGYFVLQRAKPLVMMFAGNQSS